MTLMLDQLGEMAFAAGDLILRFYKQPVRVTTKTDQSPLSEADQNLVMHVELPILAGHILMGTDAPESMGFTLKSGNNIYLNLEPDTRAETDRLFTALAEGG